MSQVDFHGRQHDQKQPAAGVACFSQELCHKMLIDGFCEAKSKAWKRSRNITQENTWQLMQKFWQRLAGKT
jgi:hypothetical protein